MIEPWWLVSSNPDDQGESADGAGWQLVLVEGFASWSDAKKRYVQIAALGHSVDLFDFEGTAVMSDGSWVGDGPHMTAPMVAGVYRFDGDADVYTRVGLPPLQGWRRTPGSINQQRTGRPVG
jgi:hypothetical protein